MDFDYQWLLLGLPLAFALGWAASRMDVRQWKRDQRDSPNAYFRGLSLLLNEQQDKAIDAFIEAIQRDPDTTDLHFALGSLFRRRGEVERAVRVHEHLLSRADLKPAERERAQHGLAQDYLSAGLFDRAETAWRALLGTDFDTDARLTLLTLHERSRDWHAAIDDAAQLERTGTGSYQTRIAHHWCELAAEADADGRSADGDTAIDRAREAAPQAARPLLQQGARLRTAGRHAEAVAVWDQLQLLHPLFFALVAVDYAASAMTADLRDAAGDHLLALQRQTPSLDLVRAIGVLDPSPPRQRQRLTVELQRHPSLSAARAVLAALADHGADATAASQRPADNAGVEAAPLPAVTAAVTAALDRAAVPLQRYRCAACGFEAQRYFWQCPGCLHWDSYPPQRLEDL